MPTGNTSTNLRDNHSAVELWITELNSFSLSVKRTNKTINSLEELENQSKTKYGVLSNGSVQKFFKESEDPLYLKMFLHMREHQTFMNATSEGVRKARNEDYAYITEQPYLEYYNQQKPCNTRLLKNLLQAKGYGIGLQQNSPYTNRISVAILAVSEKLFDLRYSYR